MFDTWKRLRGVSLVNPIEQRPQADSDGAGNQVRLGNDGTFVHVCPVALTFDFNVIATIAMAAYGKRSKKDQRCQRSEGAVEASSFRIIQPINRSCLH